MHWQMSNMGVVWEMKTLGAMASQNGNPSSNKVYLAKQNIKSDGDAYQHGYVNKYPWDWYKKA